MGCIAAAIAVAGVAATAYSAVSASNSAANAQAQNAANVSNTNQLNYQMFLQSRGSTGSALLPIYAEPAEQELYGNTLKAYNTAGQLQPTASQLQAIVAAQQPSQTASNAAAAGLFNGNLQSQLLSAQQPVYQAQLQAAQTQKQGTLEALQSTLNNIKSIQAGKGYAGDSFGNQLLSFGARQQANTNIANAVSQANVSNAQAQQGIKTGVLNTQLSNLNLPGQTAASNAGLASLAGNTFASNQAQRNQLFNQFMIGNKGFNYQNLPQVNPIASTGQIAGQAAGSLASGIGNYAANQSLIQQLNSANGQSGTGGFIGNTEYQGGQPAVTEDLATQYGNGTLNAVPVGESVSADESSLQGAL